MQIVCMLLPRMLLKRILVFESNGQFTGYFGTIQVKISLWEKFWRKLASKEERSRQQLFIPTEFTGIDIDSDGFVYASNIDSEGVQGVRRLNPKGEDVIIKGESQNLGGDIQFGVYGEYGGPSEFIDVVYREKGIYSLLIVREAGSSPTTERVICCMYSEAWEAREVPLTPPLPSRWWMIRSLCWTLIRERY